jgi:hypothetical protein
MPRKVLVLHEPGAAPAGATALAGDLRALGAEVALRPCEAPYDAVLDAVAAADSVLFWD